MTNDRYAQWRDNGCPCGCIDCMYNAKDPEAQNCYGVNGAGDPQVAICKEYVPDPFAVLEMAKQGPKP